MKVGRRESKKEAGKEEKWVEGNEVMIDGETERRDERDNAIKAVRTKH